MHPRSVSAKLLLVLPAVMSTQVPAAAKVPAVVRLDRAEQLRSGNDTRLATNDEVPPRWRKDGTRSSYRKRIRQGAELVIVAPVCSSRELPLGNARLPSAIRVAADTRIDTSRLPLRAFRVARDGDDDPARGCTERGQQILRSDPRNEPATFTRRSALHPPPVGRLCNTCHVSGGTRRSPHRSSDGCSRSRWTDSARSHIDAAPLTPTHAQLPLRA